MFTQGTYTHHRARVAYLCKIGADSNQIDDERRAMRAAKLADHIRAVVDAAPPLTAEQRDRLAVLLRGGDA